MQEDAAEEPPNLFMEHYGVRVFGAHHMEQARAQIQIIVHPIITSNCAVNTAPCEDSHHNQATPAAESAAPGSIHLLSPLVCHRIPNAAREARRTADRRNFRLYVILELVILLLRNPLISRSLEESRPTHVIHLREAIGFVHWCWAGCGRLPDGNPHDCPWWEHRA